MVECVRNLPVHNQAQAAWSPRTFPDAVVSGASANTRLPEFDAVAKRGGDILHLPVLRKDAVLVVLQIPDFRSCRLWIDGSTTPVEFTFGSAREIAASGGNAPSLPNSPGLPNTSGRWFHFHVSRKGSAAPLNEAPRPASPLPYPPSVLISDAIDPRLGECLVAAMRPIGGADKRLNERLLETLLECLLLSLHVHVARPQMRTGAPATAKRGGLAPWQVRRAQQIMSEKTEGPVSIEELAAACRLSQSHFARAFKVVTGQAPHRWHLGYRVEQAKQLMIESDRSLADIALSCGFADQSHFAKIFSRFVGSPPGAWRRAQYRVMTPAPSDMRVSTRHSAGNDNSPAGMLGASQP